MQKVPSRLAFEAPDFLVRTLGPEDAELDWGDWLCDPETAANLNAAPRRMSVEERRAYIARFDNRDAFLFGIFEKAGGAEGRLCGFWNAYADHARKEALFNILIGVREKRLSGVAAQTRDLVYRHFFETLGFEALSAGVLSRNRQMLEQATRHGWTIEGSETKQAADGGEALKVFRLRLTREAWRGFLATQAEMK